MSVISVLPAHVADLIAAGEVVERPASVVKELLENSIDAGARALTVEIRQGGSSFIRVSDDGEGMEPEDAARAFLRHATSKLREAGDLAAIRTMGFRGEALAAIAAVSRIDVLTRRRGAELGRALTLEAGAVRKNEASGCPEGTTIIVRDLFYNTPARQKFLKRDNTEAAHVQETVTRAAMGRPDISIRLLRDGTEVIHTPGDGDLQSALYCLFGREFAKGLVPADLTRDSLRVSGFVGKPENSRTSRSQQYFMVLGRPVRSRVLTAALDEAYKGSLMTGRMPVCVLHIEMPPELFDINVHPAKAEIKFQNERAVFDAVYHAVKSALSAALPGPELRLAPSPALTFGGMSVEEYRASGSPGAHAPASPSRQAADAAALFAPEGFVRAEPPKEPQREAPPVLTSPKAVPVYEITPPPGGYASPVQHDGGEGLREAALEYDQNPEMMEIPLAQARQTWRYIGQAMGGFLLVESPECLWIIDKHAAHERLLYNKLKEAPQEVMSQRLLTPQIVSLSAPECDALLSEREFLSNAGFELDSFGPGTLAVRSGPFDVDAGDIPALLSELAALLRDKRRPDVRDEALHTIACKAAVKLGRSSSDEDMRQLARLVMETPDLRHCPHGRPVAIRLTRGQLSRQFGR